MSIKISKRDLIAFFLCFTYIPIYVVQQVFGENIYLFLVVLSGLYLVIVALKDNVISISFLFAGWMVLLLWMLLCTFLNGENLLNPVYYVGRVALWILANELYLQKDSLRLLRVSRKFIGTLAVITVLQQIIAPEIFGRVGGIEAGNHYTFFASDNFLGYYYNAYIALCIILDYIDFGKIRPRTYLMMGVCFLSICLAWAVKNVIGFGVLIIYILFIYRKKISEILNARVLMILYVLIFVAVVFLNVQENFIWFFSKYFGKDNTVSVRYFIWMQAVELIRESPIFGYGVGPGGKQQMMENFGGNARSSHNLFLELALQGGIVAVLIYVGIVVRCLLRNDKRFRGETNYEYLFLLFNIFVFYVMQLASGGLYRPFYYVPLILINNLDKIISIGKREKTYA